MDLHRLYVLKALLVTVLWSSSWVIIKQGLEGISPLIFASLRYLLASSVLLTLLLFGETKFSEIKKLSKSDFGLLLLYGLVFISFTQGLQFIALDILPAITISFVLNFSAFVVIILSSFILQEKPSKLQFIFLTFAIFAGTLYFYPITGFSITLLGIIVLFGVLMSNSIAQILGRYINHNIQVNALIITSISMMFGSLVLFIFAMAVEGLPKFTTEVILIISWLAVVNTALAFTLWNQTMEHLKAYESSIINNTMLPQIAILAYLFLDERPSLLQWVSLVIVLLSAVLVTIIQQRSDPKEQKIDISL